MARDRYRLKLKRLDFISGVDAGAQGPIANVALIKGAKGDLRGITLVDPALGQGVPINLIKRADPGGFEATFRVAKTDESLGLVFGWAMAGSIDGGKTPHVDLQDDAIDVNSTEFLKVCAEFMEGGAATDVMHDGEQDGRVVFAFPLIPEINKALGIETSTHGLAIAMKPSAETFKRFQSGELAAFSIGGVGERTPLAKSKIKKSASLYTDEVDGHQHQIDFCEDGSMWCSWATSAGADTTHSHAVSQDANGGVVILADSGHTHALADGQPAVVFVPDDAIIVTGNAENDAVAMRAPSTNRTSAKSRARESSPSNTGRTVALMSTNDTQIADLTKRLERADRIVKMTGAHKTFFDSLAGDDAETFLAKTATEREAVIKAAADADPVEFTLDGVDYRKSTSGYSLAKRIREQAEQIEKAAIVEVAKQFSSLPGDDATQFELAKAVRAMTGDVKAKVLAMLKGASGIAKGRSVPDGLDGEPAEVDMTKGDTAGEQLDALTTQYATKNNVTKSAARVAVLKTDEGRRLYNESTRS